MKRNVSILFLITVFLLGAGCSSNNKATDIDSGGKDLGQVQDLTTDTDTATASDSDSVTDTAPDSAPDTVTDTDTDTVTDTDTDTVTEKDQGPVEPFKVKTTVPKDEATNVVMPFTVTVTFNRGVRPQSILSTNFYVLGPDGKEVPGTTGQPQSDQIVFTPNSSYKFQSASPYTVILTTNLMDESGDKLEGNYQFTFYTGVKGGTDKYKALAVKYSPIIYQAVNPSEPKADYLTRVDFDKDWDAHNNWLNLQTATAVPSDVYYDCVETVSHYFIYYVYYHGLYNSDTSTYKHGNDMSGSVVVIAKYPKEHPIAVENYFQAGQSTEEILTYATNESGIVPDGKDKNKFSVDDVFSEAQLFPVGHFLAYITAKADSGKDHETCLWIDEKPAAPYCKLSKQIKSTLKTIKYVYSDGTEQQIKAVDNAFPAQMDEASYALRSLLNDLWTRRMKDGNKGLFTGSFQYWNLADDPKNPDNRPGAGTKLPLRFVDSVNEGGSVMKGKPPWAWKWNHEFSTNPNLRVYDMPKGIIIMDPAYYFIKRHNINTVYNPQTKEGFSLDYCFNPYLGIDNRKNMNCIN